MKLLRRQFLQLAGAAAAVPALPQLASALDYPTRPVRIIAPFAAGGPADVYARIVTQNLAASLKQPFVVENRPGAGTIIGTDVAAKAAPDGYTLLIISNTHATNETLFPDKSFKLMRDFVPVSPIFYTDLVMVVHPSVPAKDVKELIALAKSKPGSLNYASSGIGSNYHMAGELFKAMTATDIVHVPYKGSSGARSDILGGQVQLMFDSISSVAPNVRAGQLRALGTTGTKRSTVLIDVPTIDEAGVPGYQATGWVGLMAPTGTPKTAVDLLNSEITRIITRPELSASWAARGDEAMPMTAAEFDTFLRSEIDKWAHIVKIAGVKAN
jgi:tripartite-type tricarboxylate transporter receptor subunit TctC